MLDFWLSIVQSLLLLNYATAHKPVVYSVQSPRSNADYYRTCAPRVRCDPQSKYRTFNGSCNNLEHASWGSSNTPHLRLVDAVYNGGEREFRKQVNGLPLPGPRELQNNLFQDVSNSWFDDYNVHLMEWGQFLAHDITLMPPDGSGPADCCAVQNQLNAIPYQCRAVIRIPKDDPVYTQTRRNCMPFRRATTSSSFNCAQLPNIFMVQTSQYIDASQVYGSNDSMAASLRTFRDGRLRSELVQNGQEFCPQRRRMSSVCDGRQNVGVCYDAGDPRVNQNLGIASYQNVFLRFHNYIATHLQAINPRWSDEIIYQEVRRIIGAIIQIITYKEFIPSVIGKRFSEEAGLSIYNSRTVYDKGLMSSTGLEFAAAAYRILHNIIPTQLNYIDESHRYVGAVNITDFMNMPGQIQIGSNLEYLLTGMSETSGRKNQPSYNNLISNFMFHFNTPDTADSSLIATDIQRGRDTGLPPYFVVRQQCKLSAVKSFEDLLAIMVPNEAKLLKNLYASVYDVDLVVGMLLEIPEQGSMVGPTARCILADGFYRFRYADRFFFDVQGQPGSFTQEQQEVLKGIDVGHILCVTTKMREAQKEFFRAPGHEIYSKQTLKCKEVKNMSNFSAWRSNTRN
ncbi:peroxidase-like [Adelges cooleyi]|uniref:peroxidase-like n=1 Tax=Adelges cooleyi TaxID=133065 RepID=UPI00217FA177|nr:peroxidase-like [Adelges cooleyi]